MTFPFSSDDRPDPSEQHAVRARVPDHVARGVFSTGVIVMTAPTEFVIDFIQNLGRPHQVVARIVMPHAVLPQFVDALLKNIDLYRGRYGNLPQPNLTGVTITNATGTVAAPNSPQALNPVRTPASIADLASSETIASAGTSTGMPTQEGSGTGARSAPETQGHNSDPASGAGAVGNTANRNPQGPGVGDTGNIGSSDAAAGATVRRASAQEIYDDLKMRDEILSGSYANAVMIGHGPHEFSFDFITNFYPHSAVSSRVFMAAGQVARLAESLRGAWDQIRHRFQQPPGTEPPPPGF